jgi:hypothetical protein
LARAIGEELGARARLFQRWDIAAALWRLDVSNEAVWIGDEGTTEVGEATRREGIEIETRYELMCWLAADLDLTLVIVTAGLTSRSMSKTCSIRPFARRSSPLPAASRTSRSSVPQ